MRQRLMCRRIACFMRFVGIYQWSKWIIQVINESELTLFPASFQCNAIRCQTHWTLAKMLWVKQIFFLKLNSQSNVQNIKGSQWLRVSVWIVLFLAVFGNFSVLIVLFSNWWVLSSLVHFQVRKQWFMFLPRQERRYSAEISNEQSCIRWSLYGSLFVAHSCDWYSFNGRVL